MNSRFAISRFVYPKTANDATLRSDSVKSWITVGFHSDISNGAELLSS